MVLGEQFTCLHFGILKLLTLMVHEVVSIQSLSGNIDCSSALILVESSLEPLSSMTLYKLIALLLWLLQSLACLSLVTGLVKKAIVCAHYWVRTRDFRSF